MLIEVEALSKAYGRRRVLTGVDLTVERGEVVALAGKNGAGKTTLINVLMGLLLPDEGRVEVLGETPASRRHLDRTGWMPEKPEYPRRCRVADIVELQAATFPRWNQSLAGDLGERLAIEPRARTESLSRGQKARLALLLSLASEPRVLILDDPTLGLDPATRRLLLGELLADAAERGTGVLVSTHLLTEFDTALDRLLILQEGHIELALGIDDLKESHRRLILPREAPPPPPELVVRQTDGWLMTTRWDVASWNAYRSRCPDARVESLGVEDIFIALTGDRP